MRKILKLLVVGASALLGACATMVNPGKTRMVEPMTGGPHVKVGRLKLEHAPRIRFRDGAGGRETWGLDVYDGNTRLQIMDESDDALRDRMCRVGLTLIDTVCTHTILYPYVELNRAVPHTLRLVSAAGAATVTVRARVHFQWIWFNAIWGVAMPIGWAVDAASGSWQYFGNLDVADTYERLASSARGTR